MSGLAILVPALRRPGSVEPFVRSVARTTPKPYRVVFIADADDRPTHEAVDAAGVDLIRAGGSYAHKINLAAAIVREPLLFTAADDLRFHEHWLERALDAMRGPVCVVGTNDLGNPRVMRGEHATHFLVRRAYCARGTIDGEIGLLHEGYRHCFVDDEVIATARARGVYAMAVDSHVEHLHPDWNKAPDDEVYGIGRAAYRDDRLEFYARRELWT